MALLAAVLGVYALIMARRGSATQPVRVRSQRGEIAGAAITLIGLAWFYVTTFVIIPHYAAQVYGLAQTPYAARYGALGDSFADVIKSFVTRPAGRVEYRNRAGPRTLSHRAAPADRVPGAARPRDPASEPAAAAGKPIQLVPDAICRRVALLRAAGALLHPRRDDRVAAVRGASSTGGRPTRLAGAKHRPGRCRRARCPSPRRSHGGRPRVSRLAAGDGTRSGCSIASRRKFRATQR